MSTAILASELLNEAQAAEFLGLSPGTLSVWRCLGRYSLPYVKVGRLVRYRLVDLEAWLRSREATHTGDSVPSATH
jgi:hypothetical protein